MRTAYLDCFSGVSGDMLLGALVDAGLPESLLREVVAALRLDWVALEISRPVVQGFAATRVQVHGPRHHHEHHHAHRHLAEIATLTASLEQEAQGCDHCGRSTALRCRRDR